MRERHERNERKRKPGERKERESREGREREREGGQTPRNNIGAISDYGCAPTPDTFRHIVSVKAVMQ